MEHILISACLLGQPVRYDGKAALCAHPLLDKWRAENRLIIICPEMAGGLPVPRPSAEIQHAAGGAAVLQGQVMVCDKEGNDLSAAFVSGAQQALQLAQRHQIRLAILKEASPSCGSHVIYDGSFSGNKVAGEGATSALLRQHGITVFNEHQLAEVAALLLQSEN